MPRTSRDRDWTLATDAELLAAWDALWPVVRCGWDRLKRQEALFARRRSLMPLYDSLVAEIQRRAALPGCDEGAAGAYRLATRPFPKRLTEEAS